MKFKKFYGQTKTQKKKRHNGYRLKMSQLNSNQEKIDYIIELYETEINQLRWFPTIFGGKVKDYYDILIKLDLKKCSSEYCVHTKLQSYSQFSKDKHSIDGRKSQCITCTSQNTKNYSKNKGQVKFKNKQLKLDYELSKIDVKDYVMEAFEKSKNSNSFVSKFTSAKKIRVMIEKIHTRTSYLNDFENIRMSERLYHIVCDIFKPVLCSFCKTEYCRYDNFGRGYFQYCSTKCSNKSLTVKKKKEETCLINYGVTNPNKSKVVRERTVKTNLDRYGVKAPIQNKDIMNLTKETNLERYGFESATQNQEVRDKIKKTNLKRYGTDNPLGNKEIQEKAKQTKIKKFGTEFPTQTKEIKEKTKETNLERLGVEFPLQNQEVMDKVKKTNLKRYGSETPFQNEEVKQKIKETNLDRLGVEFPTQNKDVRKKIKETNLERLGVEFPLQNKEVMDKVKKTNLKRYGSECVLQNEEIKQKIKETNLDRYGFESSLQNEDVRKKIKETNLERFGTEFPSQTKEIKEKIKETNLERFGTEFPLQNQEVMDKVKKTNLKRYGTDNPLGNKEIQEKAKQTKIKKFGTEFPTQTKEIKEKTKETNLERYGVMCFFESDDFIIKQKVKNYNFIKTSKRLGLEYELITTYDEYVNVKHELQFKHKKCGYIFDYKIDCGKFPRCTKCYPPKQLGSISETEVLEFTKKYSNNIIKNDRTVISPLELDIYIPELKLAIEFDGIYWHSEKFGKDKNYHLNKTKLCNEKDIQLVHIFEDEWIDKKEIIKSILLNKFNRNSEKIFARKCEIGEISNTEAKDFMFENHIQGFVNGTHYALAYEDKLVSVMTVGKSRFDKNVEIEVYRFCSKLNHQVLGGLSRLTKHVERTLKPVSIVTYADLRFGVGKGYLAAGYTFDSITNPGYFYVKSGSRFSRQKFQKHKLKKILNTFDESLTESQNMFENGYNKIWDCGNVIFKKILT